MNFFTIVLLTTSILSGVCTCHQTYKVLDAKQKHTVSYVHVTTMCCNLLAHFVYTFTVDDLTLKCSIGIGFVACFILLSVMLYYAYMPSSDDVTRYLNMEIL